MGQSRDLFELIQKRRIINILILFTDNQTIKKSKLSFALVYFLGYK